jgi:uncharacterized protein (TIGR03437 family)
MNTFADQIHVIQNEEAPLATAGLGAFAAGLPPLAIDQGLVLHADGTPVRVKPARPGEELVMFALGLGKTTPAAQTGQASPPEATVPVQLRFDFTADARPKLSYAPTQNEFLRFAGLSPGSVGLYQVNFKVPKPPPGTPSCPTQSAASNLTVTISGQASFDGAAVCVAVGQ